MTFSKLTLDELYLLEIEESHIREASLRRSQEIEKEIRGILHKSSLAPLIESLARKGKIGKPRICHTPIPENKEPTKDAG